MGQFVRDREILTDGRVLRIDADDLLRGIAIEEAG
jgi:hypothetical protein